MNSYTDYPTGRGMTRPKSNEEVLVDGQMCAFNAHDLEALMDHYAEEACIYAHPATLLAKGRAAIRARYAVRLAQPNVHVRLLERIVMGAVVIDRREMTRTFEDGPGVVDLLCVYEVRDALIRSVSLVVGPQHPGKRASQADAI